MYVINTKYDKNHPYIFDLVASIRKFEWNEQILIIDSASSDKSYFRLKDQYPNITIADINNKNYCLGAYFWAFNNFPSDYYYFMQDSLIVKGPLQYLKKAELTLLGTFHRNNQYLDYCNSKCNTLNLGDYSDQGFGVYGPMWFCRSNVMESLVDLGASDILPISKEENNASERLMGFLLEKMNFNLLQCSMHGNILFEESILGRSGPPPHNTSWQYPVEKFYARRD